MRALIGVVLALLAGTASAATIEDCNALPDGQRLDCYGRVLGVQPSLPEEVKRRTEPCADQIQRYREDEYMRAQRHEPSAPPPHCMVEMNRNREMDAARVRAAAADRERFRRITGEPEMPAPDTVLISPPQTSHAAAPRLAPIEEGAISRRIGCDNGCERSNAYERFSPYLAWAAERERRDPNCLAVETVSLSLSKSTQSEPVFFVTCRGNVIGGAFNTWHTKTELDQFRLSVQP